MMQWFPPLYGVSDCASSLITHLDALKEDVNRTMEVLLDLVCRFDKEIIIICCDAIVFSLYKREEASAT